MNHLQYALLSVHLLTLASTISLNSLWIPPGSKGSIDFRHPNYIVDPYPPCPQLGYFPHPRNCSYFYRCFSLYVEGFYFREYFECAPGTIFDDVLDVCVRGSSVEGCETESDREPNATTPEPPPNPGNSCTDCTYYVDQCEKVNVCPMSTDVPVQLQLCETAVSFCSPCLLSERVCEDQVFSTSDEKCYPPKNDPSMVCPDTTEPTTTVSPATEPPTTEPPTTMQPTTMQPTTMQPTTIPPPSPPDSSPCDDCSISFSRCQPRTVCPNGGSEVTLTLCPIAEHDCPDECDREKNVCAEGEYYSILDELCYPSPDSSAMSCEPVAPPEVQTPAPPIEVVGGTITITKPIDTQVVACSVSELIPKDDWIQKEFCRDIHLCTLNEYKGKTTLCTNYYECSQNDDGSWDAIIKECAVEYLFSFEEESCVPAPTKDERC